MSPFDRVIAAAQVMLLAAWEALGVLAFGWNGWYILAFWFVGLWSFNVLTATGVRTYFKLITPGTSIENTTNINIESPEITEDDIG